MINLNFFPSPRLARYTVWLYVSRSLAVLLSLSIVLMMLNLLSESGKILAVAGNGEAQLWAYVGYRFPQLIAFAFPFSFLLGALITFTTLNQSSEVVAMKAAGLSAHQLLAPLMAASAVLAGVSFAFNELVVVNGTRQLSAWQDNDYKAVPPDSGIVSNVWVTAGDDLVQAKLVTGRGNGVQIRGLRMFERESNTIRRIVDAERARPYEGGWILENVSIYDSGMNMVLRRPAMRALEGVEPQRFTLAKVDPNAQDIRSLTHNIGEMERAGVTTATARTGLWHKLAQPLSTVLMPLLAAIAAFGLARSGKVLVRAVIGMALGFAYFVIDNFAVALGNVGAYPPLLAAWAPFLLFLLIGETVMIRLEE
ncbi:LPS export ABC transporter permease LptG [Sphingomonas astaxanthinifaciens]|uniref:LPS export ABC transporter permease LptG n=1 Tax=Sphingomonas astaxanthinifaciens DSM 22298 TaxID=1123267 RepID=A0ABQ5Z6N6_9SPHN|nr:LPS export ABC transporter permease LptG [Sphingomonas astaxanthinifaciens]GLR47186.1 LPS export ABC transporter permease LptG [Sphingomonas astaxanthinifaciens DSM 22298]